MKSDLEIIVLVIIGFILVIGITYVVVSTENRYLKTLLMYCEMENEELKTEHSHDFTFKANLSDRLIEFIDKTCAKIAIIKFQEFKDSHDMTKVTEANVKSLIESIANDVHLAMDISIDDLDESLYKADFIEKYIIDTCIMNAKSLLNEYINNIEEIS